jgi:hypothetical protein
MSHSKSEHVKIERGNFKRGLFVLALSTIVGGSIALAQNVSPKGDSTDNPAATHGPVSPPQRRPPNISHKVTQAGPIRHPAVRPLKVPQGDTPAGMQPNPDDSKKDSVPKK